MEKAVKDTKYFFRYSVISGYGSDFSDIADNDRLTTHNVLRSPGFFFTAHLCATGQIYGFERKCFEWCWV